MKKVMIIEDEENIRRLLAYDLKQAGYDVYEARDGEEAFMLSNTSSFDCYLIDWMLPGISGIDILKQLQEKNKESIYIMLTAKDEEESMLEAFEAGVSDYIIKPFSPRILVARINAHMKSHTKQNNTSFSDIKFDDKRRKVYVNDKEISLTKKEYEVLAYFVKNANIVISRDQILNDIWGFDYDGDTRIVDVHIFKIRNKLKGSKSQINSNRGIGYILEETYE